VCPTGRLSSGGTLDRPGEAVCVRLLSSLSQTTRTVPAPQTNARFINLPVGHIYLYLNRKKRMLFFGAGEGVL